MDEEMVDVEMVDVDKDMAEVVVEQQYHLAFLIWIKSQITVRNKSHLFVRILIQKHLLSFQLELQRLTFSTDILHLKYGICCD